MGAYNYEHFICDFVYRTRKNYMKISQRYEEILEIIKELKDKNKYYNSYNDYHEESDFIRYMRNSLAHSGNQGIHFLQCQEGHKITSVIFYDNDKDYGETSEFCVELTIEEIRELTLAEM